MLDTAGATRYEYDVRHRLTRLTDSADRPFTFGYDALSLLTQVGAPNGVITTQSFDATSQLLSVTHKRDAAVLAEVDYTYDAAGNRSGEVRGDGIARAFGYDPADRLLSAASSQPATLPPENFTLVFEGCGRDEGPPIAGVTA